ncbi:MAG: zinc ribbon domain-containing protein [Coriobacteriia bacterium]|nr:zinc ribbon domain-containing protein [Coriobacteriia bacterium]
MGEIFGDLLNNPAVVLLRNLCVLFWVVFHFALTFWTLRDANRRGAMGWFWGITVFLFDLAGWVIYLVVRPPEFAADARERDLEIRAKEVSLQRDLETCPACYKPVEKEFLICPYCMKKLRKPCIECEQPLKLNWNVCPYCKTKQ